MKAFCLLILISFSFSANADDEQLRDVMRHLADSLLTLMPIVQNRDFDAEKFELEAQRLHRYVQQAERHFDDQPVSARITYGMLKERIEEASRLSADSSMISARSLLSESLELCASCHAQDRKSRPGFGISRLRELDEFQAAEFSFLSRDYASALTSYKNFLTAEKSDGHRRSLALDRILSITTEIYGDLDAALQVLKEIRLVSESEKIRVTSWQSVFRNLKSQSPLVSPLAPQDIRDMDRFLTNDWPAMQSFMNWNEQQAYWMMIRRKLNTFLENGPSAEETPVLLYWQAVADRSTHFQFYESLSRRYLERCMREYPGHAYARKCFDEFELLMIVSFSGSGGINIPVEVREEINELRRIVYSRD